MSSRKESLITPNQECGHVYYDGENIRLKSTGLLKRWVTYTLPPPPLRVPPPHQRFLSVDLWTTLGCTTAATNWRRDCSSSSSTSSRFLITSRRCGRDWSVVSGNQDRISLNCDLAASLLLLLLLLLLLDYKQFPMGNDLQRCHPASFRSSSPRLTLT